MLEPLYDVELDHGEFVNCKLKGYKIEINS